MSRNKLRTAHRVTYNSMLLSFGILAGATVTTLVTRGTIWDLTGAAGWALGGVYAVVCALAVATILLDRALKRVHPSPHEEDR